MRAAIDILMKEHRFIEEVAGALETLTQRVREGLVPERSVIARFGAFLKDFVDRTHHGKEEDRLFVKMTEHGFPTEYGPIGVMLAEHVEGRSHTRAIINLGAGDGPLAAAELSTLMAAGNGYVPLIRSHIGKEDNILYPMAMRVLPISVLDQLEKDFFEFDKIQIGEAKLDEYVASGKELVTLFPPDPARVHPVFVGCHS